MWRTRGHDAAVELLKSSLARERVSHAYLITGPDRIGKSTLARELAMALNCTAWQAGPQPGLFGPSQTADAEPGPCYQCASCLKAVAGSHPDVVEIESWTTERGYLTNQVRAIQYGAGLLPFEGRRKVYLLLNAADMTPAAQNTLLKTLEEPAPTVCLILTAPTPLALLPTVVSRCQHIQLHAPTAEVIAHALRELKALPPEETVRLAGLSAGRIGWAMAAADNPELLERRSAALAMLPDILGSGTAPRFRLAETLASEGDEALDQTLELWVSWLRDALLLAEGLPNRTVNRDQLASMAPLAERLGSRAIQMAIRHVQAARAQVATAINSRMAVEVLMLRLPRLAGEPGRTPAQAGAPGSRRR